MTAPSLWAHGVCGLRAVHGAMRVSGMERLGKYTLERKIATGGMAEVFVARRPADRFGTICVVKRLLPELIESPDFVQMFLDEAKLAAQLSHPGIAQIYDFGAEG